MVDSWVLIVYRMPSYRISEFETKLILLPIYGTVLCDMTFV